MPINKKPREASTGWAQQAGSGSSCASASSSAGGSTAPPPAIGTTTNVCTYLKRRPRFPVARTDILREFCDYSGKQGPGPAPQAQQLAPPWLQRQKLLAIAQDRVVPGLAHRIERLWSSLSCKSARFYRGHWAAVVTPRWCKRKVSLDSPAQRKTVCGVKPREFGIFVGPPNRKF